jgi:hypothetical protein
MSVTLTDTVADLCKLRRNCRAGLTGLAMRHIPTGREFVCLGTWWGGNETLRLQVEPGGETTRGELVAAMAERLGEGTPAYLQAVDSYDRLGLICAADIPMAPHPASFTAAECVLLERWPVTCCRPSRR